MIDRQLLRYLLAVVDRGNFTRAAAACAVTQPTLSAGIARLEAALATPVFERTSRRVALTPAGARVLAHARRVEAGFAEIERTVRPDPPAMLVRIGIVATLPSPWIEAALTAARAAAPAERIELVEGRMRDLSPRLDRGRLDAIIGILPPDSAAGNGAGAGAGEADRPLFTEAYAMALPPDHPLARRASVRVEEVAAGPMIVRRHCEALPAISRFFTARGVRPFMSARVTDDERALACVRAGLGLTVMPHGHAGRGIAMPLLDGLDLTRTIGLRHAPGTRAGRSTALAALAEAIRQAGTA